MKFITISCCILEQLIMRFHCHQINKLKNNKFVKKKVTHKIKRNFNSKINFCYNCKNNKNAKLIKWKTFFFVFYHCNDCILSCLYVCVFFYNFQDIYNGLWRSAKWATFNVCCHCCIDWFGHTTDTISWRRMLHMLHKAYQKSLTVIIIRREYNVNNHGVSKCNRVPPYRCK